MYDNPDCDEVVCQRCDAPFGLLEAISTKSYNTLLDLLDKAFSDVMAVLACHLTTVGGYVTPTIWT